MTLTSPRTQQNCGTAASETLELTLSPVFVALWRSRQRFDLTVRPPAPNFDSRGRGRGRDRLIADRILHVQSLEIGKSSPVRAIACEPAGETWEAGYPRGGNFDGNFRNRDRGAVRAIDDASTTYRHWRVRGYLERTFDGSSQISVRREPASWRAVGLSQDFRCRRTPVSLLRPVPIYRGIP